MKSIYYFVSLFTLIFVISFVNISAQEQVEKKIPKSAELNYLKCLESNIDHMRITAIFYLGEIKSQLAIKPLIHYLQYDNNYAARLVSALSLIKIGDPDGIAQVKKIPSLNPPESSTLENHVMFLSFLWNQYLQKNPDEALALKNIKFEYKTDI